MIRSLIFEPKEYRTDILYQTYVQPQAVMFRVFKETEEDSNPLTNESDLWTNEDLYGKTITYNDKVYKCEYNKYRDVHPNIMRPYAEISAVVTMLPRSEKDYADRLFFADRLGETYFSKMTAGHWARHLRVFGAVWLYRWILTPGTDLTTAPVLCMKNTPLLTNLTFEVGPLIDENNNWRPNVQQWLDDNNPHITIDCVDEIKEDETIEFSIKVLDNEGNLNPINETFLIDMKQGYCPSKEITTVDGIGSARITALGLKAGEKLRFKINSSHWTDYAEKRLTVKSKS